MPHQKAAKLSAVSDGGGAPDQNDADGFVRIRNHNAVFPLLLVLFLARRGVWDPSSDE